MLFLRAMAGAGFVIHGYPKVFNGRAAGLAAALAADGIPFPLLAAWCSSLVEFAGGLLLALGLKVRAVSALLFFNMSVAVFVHHARSSFAQKELALAYWSAAGALLLLGGGRFSLDKS